MPLGVSDPQRPVLDPRRDGGAIGAGVLDDVREAALVSLHTAAGFGNAMGNTDLITENPKAQMVGRRYEAACSGRRQEASEAWATHEARLEAREAWALAQAADSPGKIEGEGGS